MRLCDGDGHTVYWVFARLRLGFDRLQAGMASNTISMLITCKKGTAHAVPFLLAMQRPSPLQGATYAQCKVLHLYRGKRWKARALHTVSPLLLRKPPLSGLPNISRCENHNPAFVALRLVRTQFSSDL